MPDTESEVPAPRRGTPRRIPRAPQHLTPAIIFARLLERYGPQGWWPLLTHAGTNPTKSGAIHGYHPGDYTFPHNGRERFEIGVGAVLTQNTAWPNVERALHRLEANGALADPDALLDLSPDTLREAIRPTGYFNVKARKLIAFAEFCRALRGRVPTRPELLSVWGIGPETADSILLYAYGQPELVVDAYTRRILNHLGLVAEDIAYDDLKRWCSQGLPVAVPVYQDFHALLVEHAKRCYARRPYVDWLGTA